MGLRISGTGSRFGIEAPYLVKSGVSFRLGTSPDEMYDGDFDAHGWWFEDEGVVVEEIVEDRPVRVNTIDPGGMHGTIYTSSFLEQRTIALRCRAFLNEWDEFDSLVNELFGRMAAEGQLALSVRSRPDLYCMAAVESLEMGERIGGSGVGEFTVNFVMADPTWYSMHMTRVTIGGGSARVIYEGTVATPAIVEANVREGWFTTTLSTGKTPQTTGYKGTPGLPVVTSEEVCGVRTDTTTSPRISKTDAGLLVIDSSRHNVTYDGAYVGCMPGYDRWPTVTPNTVEISLPFDGEVTDGGELRYRARYV